MVKSDEKLECPMQTMNISLPEPMKEFVDEQVSSGRYSSASEYVRELIREDEKRKAQERLEALLLQGLQSGEPVPVTPEFWEERRNALLRRHAERQKNGSTDR
jgi:antitoxin ParD1/3/4